MTAAEPVRTRLVGGVASDRALALAGAAVLTGAYLYPLYYVIDVIGGPGGLELFAALVAGSLALAAVLGRTLPLRPALGLGAALLAVGLGGYLLVVPAEAVDLGRSLRDSVALLSGLSILRLTEAAVWVLGFTPGPLFVSTYLFLRRRYTLGVVAGGGALAFFISTGDVGMLHGLVGVLGAVAALGFGRLDHEGGSAGQRDGVVVLLVAILVVTTTLSVVPGGAAQPLRSGSGGGGGGGTIEADLVGGGDSVTIQGSIELSPTARFVVDADRPSRWRVGAFDRYTGSRWVRAGQSRAYDGPLPRPDGSNVVPLRQTVRVQTASEVMPAAWKPVRVTEGANRTRVTALGGLEPRETLEEDDEYAVESWVHLTNPGALREAGTDYPDGLRAQYTQLPESTPDRVVEFTAELTADATTAYDAATVVERWLESNKDYSLDVDRPSGDVAAGFIFDMEAGYCTYFATAMVAMLRSQGIPARFVVGYTTGDPIGANRWVVRGLNSHAWVEVYFPGHGWVPFDPTPAGPREATEGDALDSARAEGVPDVDPDVPSPERFTPDDVTNGSFGEDDPVGGPIPDRGAATPAIGDPLGGEGSLDAVDPADENPLPDRRTVLYGVVLLLGAATAVRRSGAVGRSRRYVWARRKPRGPPARRIEATFERLVYLLGRRYRPRRPEETPRAYLRAIVPRTTPGSGRTAGPDDDRVDRLLELYERAHYAGRATPADADRAWHLYGELRKAWSEPR